MVKEMGDITRNVGLSLIAALATFVLLGPLFGVGAAKVAGGVAGGVTAKETILDGDKKKK